MAEHVLTQIRERINQKGTVWANFYSGFILYLYSFCRPHVQIIDRRRFCEYVHVHTHTHAYIYTRLHEYT